MNYFLEFDFFATPYELKVYQKSRLTSLLGLTLTILVFSIGIAITVTQGSDLYKRKRPKVNRNILFKQVPETYNLDKNEFAFSFRYDGNITMLMDSTYFNFKFFQYLKTANLSDYNQNIKIERIPLEWEFCQDNKMHWERYSEIASNLDLNETYKIIEFNKHICLKNYNLTIGGDYNSPYFSNFYVEINKCVNSTSNNNNCKSTNEINAGISGVNIQFYYTSSIINSNNYTFPIETNIDSYFTKLDAMFSYSNDIYMSRQELSSDNGVIFEEIKISKNWYFEKFRELVNYTFGGRILRLYVNIGRNDISERRYYMKIQELAALVGGLVKALMIVAQIISSFFNSYKFDLMLINHLFSEVKNISNEVNNNIFKLKTSTTIKTREIIKRSSVIKHKNIHDLISSDKTDATKETKIKHHENKKKHEEHEFNDYGVKHNEKNKFKGRKDKKNNEFIIENKLIGIFKDNLNKKDKSKVNKQRLNENDHQNKEKNNFFIPIKEIVNNCKEVKYCDAVKKDDQLSNIEIDIDILTSSINDAYKRSETDRNLSNSNFDKSQNDDINHLPSSSCIFPSKKDFDLNDNHNLEKLEFEIKQNNGKNHANKKNNKSKNHSITKEKRKNEVLFEEHLEKDSKKLSNKEILQIKVENGFSSIFFDLSYFEIFLIKIFPCNNKYKTLRNKFEIYKEHLYESTDYSEVLKEIMSFKEFKFNLLKK